MNQTDRTNRIADMEERLERLLAWMRSDQPMTESVQDDYTALDQYYSTLWREDFEADERGELSPELKRGVLSEDALYNALSEFDEHMGKKESRL